MWQACKLPYDVLHLAMLKAFMGSGMLRLSMVFIIGFDACKCKQV